MAKLVSVPNVAVRLPTTAAQSHRLRDAGLSSTEPFKPKLNPIVRLGRSGLSDSVFDLSMECRSTDGR